MMNKLFNTSTALITRILASYTAQEIYSNTPLRIFERAAVGKKRSCRCCHCNYQTKIWHM